MMVLLALTVVAVSATAGLALWAVRREALATGPAATVQDAPHGRPATSAEPALPDQPPPTARAPRKPGRVVRRVPLLTEAVAYVGAVLVLAGAVTAVGQRWDHLGAGSRVAAFAGAAALFAAAGALLFRVAEPAAQRLVGVVWLISVGCAGTAAGLAASEVFGASEDATALAAGSAATGYAAALWLLRRRTPQQVALFASAALAICAAAAVASDTEPALVFAAPLWGFGATWALLGARRWLAPARTAVVLGTVLALSAPGIAANEHGWLHAVGIGTATAVMAASVRWHAPPILLLGAVAMFAYVTSTVVRYFGTSLGVPATLAVTGALVLALAVAGTRLMTAARHRPGRHARPRPG